MSEQVLWPLVTGLIGFVLGSFWKSYLGKKGENLATHEDIQMLVDQVRAVTQTTEDIKATITDKAWQREQKKTACYEMVKQIEPISRTLTGMIQARSRNNPEDIRNADSAVVEAFGKYI